jgi:hypothetical protein
MENDEVQLGALVCFVKTAGATAAKFLLNGPLPLALQISTREYSN